MRCPPPSLATARPVPSDARTDDEAFDEIPAGGVTEADESASRLKRARVRRHSPGPPRDRAAGAQPSPMSKLPSRVPPIGCISRPAVVLNPGFGELCNCSRTLIVAVEAVEIRGRDVLPGRLRWDSARQVLSLHEQGILGEEHRCPLHSDAREIRRENVFAFRLHAALDPRDEVVEGALALLAVESAMAARAKHALHEQITCPGGDGTAAI